MSYFDFSPSINKTDNKIKEKTKRKTKKVFYENGAHFKYTDLYSALINLYNTLPKERLGRNGIYFIENENSKIKERENKLILSFSNQKNNYSTNYYINNLKLKSNSLRKKINLNITNRNNNIKSNLLKFNSNTNVPNLSYCRYMNNISTFNNDNKKNNNNYTNNNRNKRKFEISDFNSFNSLNDTETFYIKKHNMNNTSIKILPSEEKKSKTNVKLPKIEKMNIHNLLNNRKGYIFHNINNPKSIYNLYKKVTTKKMVWN